MLDSCLCVPAIDPLLQLDSPRLFQLLSLTSEATHRSIRSQSHCDSSRNPVEACQGAYVMVTSTCKMCGSTV
jgi:hypothetical protein